MVLIDQGTVKPEIFADGPLVEVLAVRLSRQCRIAKPIGQFRLRANMVRNARVGGLIEGVKLHLPLLQRLAVPGCAMLTPVIISAVSDTRHMVTVARAGDVSRLRCVLR